jgi:hypothetical protein
MAQQAYNIDYDPQAKTKLVLTQRERQVEGKPPLDWTKLTSEADKIMNQPDLDNKIREWAKKQPHFFKPDWIDDPKKPIPKEDKEKFLTEQMGSLAKANGLSEQEMKSW